MTETLTRAVPADLEVRAAGGGRTIIGIAVPYDTPARIGGDGYGSYTETFRRGAFSRTLAERGPGRVKVLALHDQRRLPLGRATLLREDPAGLYAELTVSKTAAGDEVLELVRDGALDGLSIGFQPVRQDVGADQSVVRTEVRLHEISVVSFPAYDSARVAAVRAVLLDPTPNLTAARRAMARAGLIPFGALND